MTVRLYWSFLPVAALGACVAACGPEAVGAGDAGTSCQLDEADSSDVLSDQIWQIYGEDVIRFVGHDDGEFVTVRLTLKSGFGVFKRGIAPGTYTVAGNELSSETCGLCVELTPLRDLSPTFYATAGTVQVSCVLPRFTAQLSNVRTRREMRRDDGSVTFVPGPSLASAAFDVEVTVPEVP